jgi:8-oxo-dGTP pyrophosphatase MutT (NUDIX family)
MLALGTYAGVRLASFYFIVGIAVWWMMLRSGVHPTFAGVAIALTVPARPKLTSEKLLDKATITISSMQDQSKPVDVLGSRTDHKYVLVVRDFAERASTPLRRRRGDCLLSAAQRELKEETGLLVEQWKSFMEMDLSNSVIDERATVFLARRLTQGESQLEDTEDIDVKTITP